MIDQDRARAQAGEPDAEAVAWLEQREPGWRDYWLREGSDPRFGDDTVLAAFVAGREAGLRARMQIMRGAILLMDEAARLFRSYEAHHRQEAELASAGAIVDGRAEARMRKAERNGEIAGRIEAFLMTDCRPPVPTNDEVALTIAVLDRFSSGSGLLTPADARRVVHRIDGLQQEVRNHRWVADAARQALAKRLAWPDAGKGLPEVDDDKVVSWLGGVPRVMADAERDARTVGLALSLVQDLDGIMANSRGLDGFREPAGEWTAWGYLTQPGGELESYTRLVDALNPQLPAEEKAIPPASGRDFCGVGIAADGYSTAEVAKPWDGRSSTLQNEQALGVTEFARRKAARDLDAPIPPEVAMVNAGTPPSLRAARAVDLGGGNVRAVDPVRFGQALRLVDDTDSRGVDQIDGGLGVAEPESPNAGLLAAANWLDAQGFAAAASALTRRHRALSTEVEPSSPGAVVRTINAAIDAGLIDGRHLREPRRG